MQVLVKMNLVQFLREVNHPTQGKMYSIAFGLTLGNPCPNTLLASNRVKLLKDRHLARMKVPDIIQMEMYIERLERELEKDKEKEKGKGKEPKKGKKNRKEEIEFINELKSIEFVILQKLDESMGHLMAQYSEDGPPLTESELKHPEILMVWEGIRRIIVKAKKSLEGKLKDLGMTGSRLVGLTGSV